MGHGTSATLRRSWSGRDPNLHIGTVSTSTCSCTPYLFPELWNGVGFIILTFERSKGRKADIVQLRASFIGRLLVAATRFSSGIWVDVSRSELFLNLTRGACVLSHR
jgi:hypothetical protein